MRFDGFLGNEHIKEILSAAAQRDTFSHFYLLSGPAGSGRHTLAKQMTAAMLCTGAGEVPCGHCPQCKKVLSGNHPDVIIVDDPEKKTVPVELVRRARDDMFIRPNEGKRKIYWFPRAQDLGLPGQNALLKVLEEPPAYGVFLLLTDNPEKLLPTVRSRCVELKLQPLPRTVLYASLKRRFPQTADPELYAAMEQGQNYLGAAAAYLEGDGQLPQSDRFAAVYGQKDTLGLLELLISMEKCKRDKLVEILIQWRQLLAGALRIRSGLPGADGQCAAVSAARTAKELRSGIESLDRAIAYAQGNVSPAAICSALAWELR